MAELDGSRANLNMREVGSETLVVSVAGEIDVSSVEDLRPAIESVLRSQAQHVVVDVAGLEFMDSSGLAVLLRFADRFGPIRITGARPIIRRLVEIAGVGAVLVLADGPAS